MNDICHDTWSFDGFFVVCTRPPGHYGNHKGITDSDSERPATTTWPITPEDPA